METVFNSLQFLGSPNLQAMCQFLPHKLRSLHRSVNDTLCASSCPTNYVLSTAQLMTHVMCQFLPHKLRSLHRSVNDTGYVPQAMCQSCPTNYVLSTAQLMTQVMCHKPIPLAARSKAWVCDCSLAEIAGSNPTGAWVSLSCRCCVLSGRGLCDWLITRREEFY